MVHNFPKKAKKWINGITKWSKERKRKNSTISEVGSDLRLRRRPGKKLSCCALLEERRRFSPKMMRPRPATSTGFLSEMDRSSRQSFNRTGSDSFAVDTLRLDEDNDNTAGFSNHGAPGRSSAHEDESVQFYRHNENIPGYTGHVPR